VPLARKLGGDLLGALEAKVEIDDGQDHYVVAVALRGRIQRGGGGFRRRLPGSGRGGRGPRTADSFREVIGEVGKFELVGLEFAGAGKRQRKDPGEEFGLRALQEDVSLAAGQHHSPGALRAIDRQVVAQDHAVVVHFADYVGTCFVRLFQAGGQVVAVLRHRRLHRMRLFESFPAGVRFNLAKVLYHEIGHHYEARLMHGVSKRDRENVADRYRTKMLAKSLLHWR